MGECRAAYRKKALKLHPDRGGSSAEFLQLHRAYHQLLGDAPDADAAALAKAAAGGGGDEGAEGGGASGRLALRADVDRIDLELREHRTLVEAWFAPDPHPVRGIPMTRPLPL